MLAVRPKVAELVFQLYGRPLHPELFEVYHSRSVARGNYEAKIDITSAGHVVTWRYGGVTLTEVAASAHHPLPQTRRLMSYSLKGQRSDRVECKGGIRYEMSFQLEPVDPEVFWTFQQELAEDGLRKGMFHKFNASGRMALGAPELHQCRASHPQAAHSGLPYLSGRLRNRQEPIHDRIAVIWSAGIHSCFGLAASSFAFAAFFGVR